MPGPTCACDSMNDSDEQYPSSRVASSCLSRPPYRPVSASAKRIFLISSHLAAPSVSSVPASEPPMKPDRSRATSPDRLFALRRASEHLHKVEKRGITRPRKVAAGVAIALKPAPMLGIVRSAKPSTSVRFRFAPPKESETYARICGLFVICIPGSSGVCHSGFVAKPRVSVTIVRGREFIMPTKRQRGDTSELVVRCESLPPKPRHSFCTFRDAVTAGGHGRSQ